MTMRGDDSGIRRLMLMFAGIGVIGSVLSIVDGDPLTTIAIYLLVGVIGVVGFYRLRSPLRAKEES